MACWAHLTRRPVYLICAEFGEGGLLANSKVGLFTSTSRCSTSLRVSRWLIPLGGTGLDGGDPRWTPSWLTDGIFRPSESLQSFHLGQRISKALPSAGTPVRPVSPPPSPVCFVCPSSAVDEVLQKEASERDCPSSKPPEHDPANGPVSRF